MWESEICRYRFFLLRLVSNTVLITSLKCIIVSIFVYVVFKLNYKFPEPLIRLKNTEYSFWNDKSLAGRKY